MRRRFVLILVGLCLFWLAGCAGKPGGSTAPPSPTVPGALESARPTVSVSPSPEVTTQPLPTPGGEETPPPAVTPTARPDWLGAETLAALAKEWCVTYQDRFAGYDALRLDRKYWFADFASGSESVAFQMADGTAGTILFYLDEAGFPPDALAAEMLGVTEIAVLNQEDLIEAVSRSMAKLAGEKLREPDALKRFLDLAAALPALSGETYYCVADDAVGYVLMRSDNLARMQRLDALLEYAAAPEFRIRVDYDRAVEAYGWFALTTMPLDACDTRTEGELTYYRVDYPGIDTLADLRLYLKAIFSDEVVDTLLPAGQNRYADFDGKLYALDGGRGALVTEESTQVLPVSEAKLIYRVTVDAYLPGEPPVLDSHKVYDFPYEKLGDDWLFTEFTLVN